MTFDLTPVHYVYFLGVFTIILLIFLKKEIIIPCFIFIFLMGLFGFGTVIGGVQTIYNALLYAAKDFMDIILTITLISALSYLLQDLGSDYLIVKPFMKYMKRPVVAFFVLGIFMFLSSLFLWPSPSIAFVGSILVPIAVQNGLTPLACAIALSVFGYGMALSSDFIIQGAPAITASVANIDINDILIKGRPLFITMSVVTGLCSYLFNRKYFVQKQHKELEKKNKYKDRVVTGIGKIIAFVVPVVFLTDIVVMSVCGLKGSAATALICGSAVLILLTGVLLNHSDHPVEKMTDYLKTGFGFGMKIFTPVIVIGGFFFLGGEHIEEIMGGVHITEKGIINDFAGALANVVPLSKYPALALQMLLGGITGMDGSGFSGLPLMGSLAKTFGSAVHMDVWVLATLGQISAIWVGGGVLVPWALIPAAAICNVDAMALARRNFLPVMVGFLATFVVAMIMVS